MIKRHYATGDLLIFDLFVPPPAPVRSMIGIIVKYDGGEYGDIFFSIGGMLVEHCYLPQYLRVVWMPRDGGGHWSVRVEQ